MPQPRTIQPQAPQPQAPQPQTPQRGTPQLHTPQPNTPQPFTLGAHTLQTHTPQAQPPTAPYTTARHTTAPQPTTPRHRWFKCERSKFKNKSKRRHCCEKCLSWNFFLWIFCFEHAFSCANDAGHPCNPTSSNTGSSSSMQSSNDYQQQQHLQQHQQQLHLWPPVSKTASLAPTPLPKCRERLRKGGGEEDEQPKKEKQSKRDFCKNNRLKPVIFKTTRFQTLTHSYFVLLSSPSMLNVQSSKNVQERAKLPKFCF